MTRGLFASGATRLPLDCSCEGIIRSKHGLAVDTILGGDLLKALTEPREADAEQGRRREVSYPMHVFQV